MPTRIIKCCIKDCHSSDVHYHRFPNPESRLDRFNTWLNILGMDELNAMEPIRVYSNKRICSAHFESKYKSPGNPRLHQNAVPFMGLPSSPVPQKLHSAVTALEVPPTSAVSKLEVVPSTVAVPEAIPSTSAHVEVDMISTSTTVAKTERRSGILSSMTVNKKKHLSPKFRTLYRSALRWKRVAHLNNMRKRSFQKHLADADEYAESDNMAYSFTPAALTKETKRNPTARRSSRRENILNLTTNLIATAKNFLAEYPSSIHNNL